MQIASKTKQELPQHDQTIIDLSDLQIRTFPKCSFSGAKADYYIGLSNKNGNDSIRIMGAVTEVLVETGINKLLGQGWDDITWPVVLDLNKELLYHSYHAYQNGNSAIIGWQDFLSQK